jgi:hypothetical protein
MKKEILELFRMISSDKYFTENGYAAIVSTSNRTVETTDNEKQVGVILHNGGKLIVETYDFKYDWYLSNIDEMTDDEIINEFKIELS